MQFIDYGPAFNTGIPHRLSGKLLTFGNPHSVTGTDSSQSELLCVLSPLVYTIFIYECVTSQNNTSTIKCAGDSKVIEPITDGEETAYRREVPGMVARCQENNLSLNADKTKEMIIDLRRRL